MQPKRFKPIVSPMHKFTVPSRDGRDIDIDIVFCDEGILQWANPVHTPKIALCGPGECGKDLVANWLKTFTVLTYKLSTSQIASEFMFKKMLELGYKYSTPEECYNDRRNHRRLWGNMIEEYNSVSGAELYLQGPSQDILSGIRRKRELRACKNAGLFSTSIWIQRSLVPTDCTLDYGPAECNLVIHNELSREELFNTLHSLAALAGILIKNPTKESVDEFNSYLNST